uniref:Uncharacterized protein n=1 Tax=Oryza nivara TaxID=4536 RepID=A0A0E0HTV3_ORYNI
MASRDGNGGGLGSFVWSYHGGDEGIMMLMCSALLRLEPIGRLAQANSAPELHQARRVQRFISNNRKSFMKHKRRMGIEEGAKVTLYVFQISSDETRSKQKTKDWWSGNIRSKSGVEATSDGKKDPV